LPLSCFNLALSCFLRHNPIPGAVSSICL